MQKEGKCCFFKIPLFSSIIVEVEITGLIIFFLYRSLGWVMVTFGRSFGIIFLLVLGQLI